MLPHNVGTERNGDSSGRQKLHILQDIRLTNGADRSARTQAALLQMTTSYTHHNRFVFELMGSIASQQISKPPRVFPHILAIGHNGDDSSGRQQPQHPTERTAHEWRPPISAKHQPISATSPTNRYETHRPSQRKTHRPISAHLTDQSARTDRPISANSKQHCPPHHPHPSQPPGTHHLRPAAKQATSPTNRCYRLLPTVNPFRTALQFREQITRN